MPCNGCYDYLHVTHKKIESYTLSQSINLVSSKAKNQSQGLTPEFMVEPLVYTVFHLSQSITLWDRYHSYFIGEKIEVQRGQVISVHTADT